MSRIAAVVLAGGRAERLGGINKALIEVGGRSLLDYARDAVAGGTGVFVARGFGPSRARQTESAGPRAGVAAAIDALAPGAATHLFTIAVDSPFVPRDFLSRATQLIADRGAVVAAYGGQVYPTTALWQLGAVRNLPQRLRDGTAPHSLKRLIGGVDSVRLDYGGELAQDPFVNANTPDDLRTLRSLADQRSSPARPAGLGKL
jgi:molybdopterin-guanine dinucleotide biosynthesis protein A